MPERKPLADIACVMRTGESVTETALQQAIKLASANRRPSDGEDRGPAAGDPVHANVDVVAASLVADLNAKTREKADKIAEMARSAARYCRINADVELLLDKAGERRGARDLPGPSVRPDRGRSTRRHHGQQGDSLREALFRSGRPVLVATPKRPPMAAPRKAAIAWDGSSHAARAMAEMLSLFSCIEQVEVVAIQAKKDLSRFLPGADAARHLSRKGVGCSLVELAASAVRSGSFWMITRNAAEPTCSPWAAMATRGSGSSSSEA